MLTDLDKAFRDMLIFGIGFTKEERIEDKNGVRFVKVHVPYNEVIEEVLNAKP